MDSTQDVGRFHAARFGAGGVGRQRYPQAIAAPDPSGAVPSFGHGAVRAEAPAEGGVDQAAQALLLQHCGTVHDRAAHGGRLDSLISRAVQRAHRGVMDDGAAELSVGPPGNCHLRQGRRTYQVPQGRRTEM